MRLAAVVGAALVGLLGGVALTLPHARVDAVSAPVATSTTWTTSTAVVAPTTARTVARVTVTRTATATAHATVTRVNTVTPTPRTAESDAPETSAPSRGPR